MLPLDGGGVVQQADMLVTHCCAPLGRLSPLQQHQKGVLSALYAVPFPLTSLPAIGTRQRAAGLGHMHQVMLCLSPAAGHGHPWQADHCSCPEGHGLHRGSGALG